MAAFATMKRKTRVIAEKERKNSRNVSRYFKTVVPVGKEKHFCWTIWRSIGV